MVVLLGVGVVGEVRVEGVLPAVDAVAGVVCGVGLFRLYVAFARSGLGWGLLAYARVGCVCVVVLCVVCGVFVCECLVCVCA